MSVENKTPLPNHSVATDIAAKGTIIWHEFDDSQELAEALAQELIQHFSEQYQNNAVPLAAFSGGSTPKPLFEALARSSFDWSRSQVTLVDERWVSPQHELSNEAFIKQHFLSRLASQPHFIPLYAPADSVEASLALVQDGWNKATAARESEHFFDAVVMGMGGDGHTASFFPDADNIQELVSYQSNVHLQTCVSAASQVERITWSLARLLSTPFLVLHITGAAKRELFEYATTNAEVGLAEVMQLPIRSMAYQSVVPLHVYYCD